MRAGSRLWFKVLWRVLYSLGLARDLSCAKTSDSALFHFILLLLAHARCLVGIRSCTGGSRSVALIAVSLCIPALKVAESFVILL